MRRVDEHQVAHFLGFQPLSEVMQKREREKEREREELSDTGGEMPNPLTCVRSRHLHPSGPIHLFQHRAHKPLTFALGPPIRFQFRPGSLERIFLMHMPLRTADDLPCLVIFDVEPVTRSIAAVPLPLALFGFLNRGQAAFGRASEDGEQDLHEGMVGVVVGGPLAVDEAGECGGIEAFYEDERYFHGRIRVFFVTKGRIEGMI